MQFLDLAFKFNPITTIFRRRVLNVLNHLQCLWIVLARILRTTKHLPQQFSNFPETLGLLPAGNCAGYVNRRMAFQLTVEDVGVAKFCGAKGIYEREEILVLQVQRRCREQQHTIADFA